MAYNELIKNFNHIRDYMRQFYIYGFKRRGDYREKSARSYDNERRRIESWLGEYMAFRRQPEGKIRFLSVDTRSIAHNPLFQAYKAKSFTAADITLHFYILDILKEKEKASASEIADILSDEYLSSFSAGRGFDESTIRKKLKEYERLGLLDSEKSGRTVLYRRTDANIDLTAWKDAVSFFSEISPVGVIGSYIQDRYESNSDFFRFKHLYLLHCLESEITCCLLEAISKECDAIIKLYSRRKQKTQEYRIVPIRILVSTQAGRSYVLAKELRRQSCNLYRLDHIKAASVGRYVENREKIEKECREFERYLWNTSSNPRKHTEHLSMTLKVEPGEDYILQRLKREGRHGRITKIGETRLRYDIDVYDASEMRPWVRSFIGRIEDITCSSVDFEKIFREDLDMMYKLYIGGDHDIQ